MNEVVWIKSGIECECGIQMDFDGDKLLCFIDGSFDLFKKFMNAVNAPSIYNPAPEVSPDESIIPNKRG